MAKYEKGGDNSYRSVRTGSRGNCKTKILWQLYSKGSRCYFKGIGIVHRPDIKTW